MGRQSDEEVLDLALMAGHILLENGAEIYRVEETIDRICGYYGVNSENAFVLSNGIFLTAGSARESFFAKVQHIPVSGTHLNKVAAVNQLSREIVEGKHTIQDAYRILEEIRTMPGKKRWMQTLASGVGSAAFCIFFGGWRPLRPESACICTCSGSASPIFQRLWETLGEELWLRWSAAFFT